VEGKSLNGSPLGSGHFRGHEFHYSDVRLSPDTRFTFSLTRGHGISGHRDGALVKNTIGSYTHLHPVSSRTMFKSFVETCRRVSA
jgi:cobyrinic acid a,c-diamide synthase